MARNYKMETAKYKEEKNSPLLMEEDFFHLWEDQESEDSPPYDPFQDHNCIDIFFCQEYATGTVPLGLYYWEIGKKRISINTDSNIERSSVSFTLKKAKEFESCGIQKVAYKIICHEGIWNYQTMNTETYSTLVGWKVYPKIKVKKN